LYITYVPNTDNSGVAARHPVAVGNNNDEITYSLHGSNHRRSTTFLYRCSDWSWLFCQQVSWAMIYVNYIEKTAHSLSNVV